MYEEILEKMHELLKDEIKNFAGDFGKLEQAIMTTMMSFGQGLLQRIVDSCPNGYEGSSMPCDKCDGSMKFIQHRPKDIHTLFGWIKLKRAYYHCPDCGASLAPYDVVGGLGPEQLSPTLAKACCMLTVDDSFEQTSLKIKSLFGQKVSDNTIERVVHRVGSVATEQADRHLQEFFEHRHIPESQANPEILYITVDGTTAHEIDGWHEAKVSSIYWKDQHGEDISCFVARFDKSENFGWHVWLEACRCGFREAEEVVYIGDGAGWIRTEHRRHFGRATFIIDWYHASEHVWNCGKALFGEGTTATEKWVKKRLDWLWDGWTKRFLDDLKEQRQRNRSGKREAIDKLIGYVSENEQQMRYDVFRGKGYDIGSGAVEGACKNVVGKRLKQSGMIWTRLGSSSVLALRVTWLNGRWEQLWQKKPLAA